MDIKYHDPKETGKRITHKIECPDGWHQAAYGGVKAHHFTSVEHQAKATSVHVASKPSINESAFEICVELSILEALPGPRMVFMELGAGWGGQTLTFHTAILNQVVDTAVKDFCSYAVEAEPGHYGFLVETWNRNLIPGIPIYGAVSDKLGWEPFYAVQESNSNYGQQLHPRGNINVPVFTMENLVQTFSIGEIDLIHLDVQGTEPHVLAGARGILGQVRYLIVCPHYEEHIEVIRGHLQSTHTELLCMGPRSGYHEIGFPLPIHMPQDGIMVWERKV